MTATLTEEITRNMPVGSSRATVPWRDIILSTLPWAAALAEDELMEMAKELEVAAHHWADTGDSWPITELEEDWRATVDLHRDRQATEHLGRSGRKHIRW